MPDKINPEESITTMMRMIISSDKKIKNCIRSFGI